MSPSDEDFDERIKATLRAIDEAVATAQAASGRLDGEYDKYGLQRGAGRRFIDKQPAAERQKADQELAELQEEVQRDLKHAEAPKTAPSSRPMPPGRIRI